MQLGITNFKSINNITLKLAPITILLGPPASGKSNILDAIALIGYFNRLFLLDKEYADNAINLEPLMLIARFNDYYQLFRNHDLTRRISIGVSNGKHSVLIISYEQGKVKTLLNGYVIPWDLRAQLSGSQQGIRNILREAFKDRLLVEARLYGYDRYGLASSICINPTSCGFHLHLKGLQARSFPKSIMSEFGWNATTVIKMSQDVVVQLNNILIEYMNEKVEVKVLRQGSVVIFDYDFEIDPLAVSDSIFRALYYLMAIKSAMNYVKQYGLERKFILLLEEPEAHVFPYYLNILTDHIIRAKDSLYVVIATHNPILVSMLWDKVKNLKTYYVFRVGTGREPGSTKVQEIDVGKLAKELKTSEDLLLMPSHEVLSRYAIGISYEKTDKSKE